MADFSPVSGSGLNGSMLSLFDASYTSGLLVPHYLRTLKNKYGDNGLSDFQLLMGLGMKRGVQNTQGWHWEKGFYDSPITGVVKTATTPTANQVVLTVTSETGTSGSNPNPAYIDLIYAKKGQVAMIVSGSLSNIVYIADVVRDTPVGGADTFTVTLQAVQNNGLYKTAPSALWVVGDSMTLGVIGSAWAEGTDQPSSSQSFWTKYSWKTQIFKETYELTGTQKTNAPQWMEVEYGAGKTKKMNGFFYEGQDEAEYRLIKQIALSMMFGQLNTNTAASTGLAVNGVVPDTFSGLDAQIASRGATQVTNATFDLADLRTMATTMSKRYASNLFLLWLTQEYYSTLNTDMQTSGFGSGANVNALNNSIADVFYGGQMSSVDSLSGTLSYQGLVVDGYNFMIKQARFMQDPQTLANVNANNALRYRGWAIPLNKMADVDGVLRNRIELVYKEMDGYSRFMEVTDDGRASARKIGPSDVARLYLSSDLGFDFFTLEQFGRFTFA
jgi:hypothetical protein